MSVDYTGMKIKTEYLNVPCILVLEMRVANEDCGKVGMTFGFLQTAV